MEFAIAMPRSDQRLIAAIERIKPHVPPDEYREFARELGTFLSGVAPALEHASATIRETLDVTKPNTTPSLHTSLVRGKHIAHVVLAAALTGLVGL